MRGLTIVESGLDADGLGVAAATCAAFGRAALAAVPFVPFVPDAGAAGGRLDALARSAGVERDQVAGVTLAARATPLVAARHAGVDVDPAPLLERGLGAAGEADVLLAVLCGGPLAPVTERASVRDVAHEIGAPVVVAAPAGPDAVAASRAAIEALRVVGLGVTGLVLTGWPQTPDRVALDERALLAELTGLEVGTLAAATDAADTTVDWPVERWLEPPQLAASPPAPPSAGGGPSGHVVLEAYRAWEERPVADPRSAPRPQLMDALEEIVVAEGPLTATRALALANRASGGRKLTNAVRAPLSSALGWLAQERRVVRVREDEIPWQEDDVARAPGTPGVVVRELGPRELIEVPLDEIAELMRRVLAAGTAPAGDDEHLKRAVLTAYGLGRLTARADRHLTTAIELLGD